jgi:preprotein translocase subunit SecE
MALTNTVRTFTSTPQRLVGFVREAREELRKVSWPTREQAIRYTIIVVVASVAVGLLIGGIDYLFTLLIENFII